MTQAQALERLKSFPKEKLPEIKRSLYRNFLSLTAEDLLGYKDLQRRTHSDVIHALEAETKRKLIVMPRGTFKSSLCSVSYPIWLLLKDPNLRILLDSELYTNSRNLLREIKHHLESPKLTELFGEFRTDHCWRENEIIIKQRTKIWKEASITAGGIGTQKTGQHYDVILMDDLNSPTNSGTKEGLTKVIDHYRYNLSILEPNGVLVLVGTRFAELDCIGFVMQMEIGETQ